MRRNRYPLTQPYLNEYPIIGYPLIYGTDKGQKIIDPQNTSRINQMMNRASTRPVSTHTVNRASTRPVS